MGHIRIQQLSKEFEDRRRKKRDIADSDLPATPVTVLNKIDFEIFNGEMVCLLGPSGCGKSTLLRIIAGFDVPSSGSLTIDGKPVAGATSNNIFVFQQGGLLPWMTVGQNVELGLRRMNDQEEKDRAIREYIEMVDLDGFEHYFPYQLSGGMQRRAELARALAVNPDMLIMDEPFTGLDFLTHMKIREEVVNMHQFLKKTVLIVTHNIDDALVMGDRIIVFSNRPSEVKLNCRLDFPHPRIFTKEAGLYDFRQELFLMLGVNDAV